MEGFSAQSLNVTTFPSFFSRGGLVEKTSGHIKILKISDLARYPHAAKAISLKICSTRAQASGPAKSTSAEATPGKTDSKDDNLVFVAGATGRVGSRTVRELLKLGFRVRAGVRNAERADTLIQSVKQMKVDATNASEGDQPVERLEIVECDLEKPERIVLALGNASVVICSIGASEKEVFDITGPYRIDYMATKNLIDAATFAKVNHFILVTSLGTNKVGFPAAILNLFWGVLIWKRKAEEALLASGLPYTIVRPGGMERPTDSFKETHNITLSEEDTLFGGLVSNLQIAELMAVMAKNRDLSYCKIVEVVAETTAPLTPKEELLAKIPSQRAVIYSPKEPDVAAVTDPAPSDSVVAAELGITTQREPVEPKPVVKQALSPYIVYDDLKPPSSPTPAQPGGQKSVNISDTAPKVSASDSQSESGIPGTVGISQKPDLEKLASGSLSPYVAYEDLKPPTSPSPTPPNASNDKPPTASTTVELASASTDGTAAEKTIPTSIAAEDPSREYPDFKSPTSPSPNVPSASLSSSIIDGVPEAAAESSNCPAQLLVAEEPHDGQHLAEPKSRPLSPYTMYEDLKPPASPTPSVKKF